MFGTKLNYNSHFFISGQDGTPSARELSGVQSVEIGYNNNAITRNPLGYGQGITTVSGPTEQQVSFSRYLIYDDPVLVFTGASEVMKGIFNYDNNLCYGFESGYLSSYSVNCAVGAVPSVNASFVVHGEMETGINATGATNTDIFIPSQGSITATCDNATTNRVIGFDYSLTTKKIPYYTIGVEGPAVVKHVPPIEYTASVQFDADAALLEDSYNFLGTGFSRTVTFTINGRDGTAIQSLSIPNACLVGEQIESSADGSVRITVQYRGHL